MMKQLVILFVMGIVLFSCGGSQETTTENAVMSQDEMLTQIKSMEKSLFSSTTMNKDSAEKIIAYYNDYARNFPEAKEAPEFLNKAADVAGAIQKPRIKEQNYKTILEKYSSWPGCEQVRYLLAFTLDNDLDRREEAKTYYQQVIEIGKDTNFVRDAKFRMTTIDSMTYDQFVDYIIRQAETEKVPQ